MNNLLNLIERTMYLISYTMASLPEKILRFGGLVKPNFITGLPVFDIMESEVLKV
jgi:hypothetical protein